MSFLLPPFSSTVEGGRGGKNGNVEVIYLQMIPLTSRTFRNCKMNNSAFCHFRGFPFCLYNSEQFLPSSFSLRRNCSWRSNLQGLPAACHAGGFPWGPKGSPSWGHGPVCGNLYGTHSLAMLRKLPNLRRHFLLKWFFSLIPYIV